MRGRAGLAHRSTLLCWKVAVIFKTRLILNCRYTLPFDFSSFTYLKVHFWAIKHFFIAFVLKKKLANFSLIFVQELASFGSPWARSRFSNTCVNTMLIIAWTDLHALEPTVNLDVHARKNQALFGKAVKLR